MKESLHKANLELRGRGYHLKWNTDGTKIIVMENNGAFAFYAKNPIHAVHLINEKCDEDSRSNSRT